MSARGDDTPNATLATDVGQRLDAAIRRFGGKPKASVPPSRMVLPAIGKFDCEGQLTIEEALDDEDPE